MAVNRIIQVLFVLLLTASLVDAQIWKNNRKEFFFGMGATNFLGDLGGADIPGSHGLKDLNMEASRPVFNIGYLHKWKKWFAFQHDVFYGTLNGDDSYSVVRSRDRRFCFRSPIFEFSSKFQVYKSFDKEGRYFNLKDIRGEKNFQFTPYLYAGIGFFYFNPKGRYTDGKWYALQPLSTEGQGIYTTRKKYSRLQLCVPVGIGFKVLMTPHWLLGIDFGMRKTFTDYIDDVSISYPSMDVLQSQIGPMAAYFSDPTGSALAGDARGGMFHKDVYMFVSITFRKIIPKPRRYFSTGRGKYKPYKKRR